jgi:hypothetical protein
MSGGPIRLGGADGLVIGIWVQAPVVLGDCSSPISR